MGHVVSRKAAITAGALIALHFLAWWYVSFKNMAYDQGDIEGLLWWVVAFWILPVFALLILLINFAVRLLTNHTDDQIEQ